MGKKLGVQTIKFNNKPKIVGAYSIVGSKEGKGNFGKYYDYVLKEDDFGETTYEKAEKKIIEHAIFHAIESAGLESNQVDLLLSGDLLDQIIASSFSARQFDTTYVGLYGACSTMAEALAVGSCMVDGLYFNNVACSTSSHFQLLKDSCDFL